MMIYKLRDGRPTPKVMRVRAHRLDDVRVPLFSDGESVDFFQSASICRWSSASNKSSCMGLISPSVTRRMSAFSYSSVSKRAKARSKGSSTSVPPWNEP